MSAINETNNPSKIRTDKEGRVKAEPLGTPDEARQQAVTTVSADVTLTAACRRISIVAVGCNMRYKVGPAQMANATASHLIRDGERLDFAVPVGAHIAIIRDSAATADGVLEISELT